MRWMRYLTGALVALALLIPGASADISPDLYDTLTKTATTTTTVTESVFWTPATGFRIILQGCALSTDAANRISVLSASAHVIPPQEFQSYGSVVIEGGGTAIWAGTTNATLTWTTTTKTAASIMCWGYEIK